MQVERNEVGKCTYHVDVLMLSIKVLHFTKTDFKRVLVCILYPNKRSIILPTSPQMFCCHKNYRSLLKLVLSSERKISELKLTFTVTLINFRLIRHLISVVSGELLSVCNEVGYSLVFSGNIDHMGKHKGRPAIYVLNDPTLGKFTSAHFVPDHHFCIFIVPVIPPGGAP